MRTGATIRLARPQDLPALRDLEVAAGEAFRDLGMAAVADDEPPTVAELAGFQRDGGAWIVADETDRPIAYVLVHAVDGNAHIDQVSVHPCHGRRRLGEALIETVAAWAEQNGLAGLTLTTFANVPWNAPYYERLGFRVLVDDQITGGLREIQDDEARGGLARWPRVTMRRPISGGRAQPCP